MTRVALVIFLLVLAVAPADAQAPTGFSEFAWGTAPSVLRDQVLSKRCQSSSESRRGWYSVLCQEYSTEGLKVPALRLDFEPADALAGYHMVVARTSYPTFRELVLKRFGRPTTRRMIPFIGQQLWWTWPGVSATLIEKCDEESSCLEVTTAPLDRRREAIRERERREATQSF